MFSGKQKSFLRAKAHDLSPIVQIGKNLISEALITTVNNALEAHELIKISILQNCPAEPKEVATVVASNTQSELVQVIGRTIILYKKSSKQANRVITQKIPK